MKLPYFLTMNCSKMKLNVSNLLLAGVVALTLSACSEPDQEVSSETLLGTESTNVDETNIGDTNAAENGPPVVVTGELAIEGDGSGFNDTSSNGIDLEVVNKVSPELEQKTEQMSVAELQQATEAANQALQASAEQKTVNEAQNLAASQANKIAAGAEDVSTPLASISVTTEPVAIEPEASLQESVSPIIAPSGLRTFDPFEGKWVKKSQKIAGQWRIEIRSGEAYLVLDDSFKTRKAPDLKFVLSNTPVAQLSNNNALDGALIIANLKSPSGAQVYKLPSNFDDYSTLLLHCEKYTKLWGAAAIK